MTVSSIEPVNNYTGNSSDIQFDFDFLIEKESELVVQHTNNQGATTILTNGVDYSIHEIGNKNGSYITFPLAGSSYSVLANDETISLMLSLVIKQENEIRNSLFFNFDTLEWMFDYIVRILQIMQRKIELCAKVKEGSGKSADDLINELNQAQINATNSAQEAIMAENNINTLYTNTSNLYSLIQSLGNNVTTEINNGLGNISDLTDASLSELYSKAEELGRTYLDKANNNAVVHLTGNETITGAKTFTENLSVIKDYGGQYNIQSSAIDWKTAVVSNYTTIGNIVFYDKNYVNTGFIQTLIDAYQTRAMTLSVRNKSDNGNASITLGFLANGTIFTYCPPSDAINSIITTSGISKLNTGYLKLGNGIIVQWGEASGSSGTITLPTAFTEGGFKVLCTEWNPNGVSEPRSVAITTKTLTTFSWSSARQEAEHGIPHSTTWLWLAIGY